MDDGVTCSAANAFSPTPARETAAGLLEASVVILSEAARLPDVVGTKDTV